MAPRQSKLIGLSLDCNITNRRDDAYDCKHC